ncbi:hypothetical protein R1sor_012525 [Riccia sorocarpa]|uniref:Uncharacterized protein n=1 Tax=Riccia sorocarpa TaxID=122646 RepID=A0ABD3IA76_9MARC
MAQKTRNVGRKRKEKSPIVEFPPEDAMELIDLTVSKIVETAEEVESSKHNSVETAEECESSKHNSAAAASTTIEIYRLPQWAEEARGFSCHGPVLTGGSGFRHREVFPRSVKVRLSQNSYEGVKVWFDYTGGTKRNEGWNIDELRYFAKSGRDPTLDKKCKLVMRQALKTIGRTSHIYCSTTVAFLAIVHVDPELENLRPDWHAWCANEIRFRLRHSKTDNHSKAKFRDGWQTFVELVTRDFLARQVARLQQQSQVLQLEYSSDAKNAFAETKVVWDAERGELIAERERLRIELEEAQSREEVLRQERWQAQEEAMQAEMREGALRDKHEKLQREYSSQKEEWEARNQKLSEDISVLHEKRLRITTREGKYKFTIH